ncbi:MAG: ATP-binding cassette domain-containing protein [Candidatus Hydrogenedens sp.]|nr:ATP-binding cassette domain-containing protein [Candidatus Hydrogenedens sp.]
MSATESGNVIAVESLTRKFGRKAALDNVSLAVPEGCVYGLVGGNGAGKTTLVKHLLGTFKAQTGSVRVLGEDPVRSPVEVLSRVGYLSEDRDLPGWMRVRDWLRYSEAFYPAWDAEYAERLRERFGLDPDTRIKRLSRGETAKAGLLAALAFRPPLLLLDEPSSGLDPSARRNILEAIIRTVAGEGRTVFFSSHLLEEVERVADRVAMLHQGRLVFEGTMEDLHATHHRWMLRFPQAPAGHPNLPGALHLEGDGQDWTAVSEGDAERFRTEALAAGAEITGHSGASLEEVFLARVGHAAVLED